MKSHYRFAFRFPASNGDLSAFWFGTMRAGGKSHDPTILHIEVDILVRTTVDACKRRRRALWRLASRRYRSRKTAALASNLSIDERPG
jgi:hypothetical protein